MSILLQLFWSFIQIGLFSFGGGYAAMPLIQEQAVTIHGWLTLTEFTDIVTISEMTPGPIAINAATFVGTRVAGLAGALVATFGCVLPSLVIALTLAWVYTHYKKLAPLQGVLAGLRPAVVAIIASSGLTILCLAFFGAKAIPAALSQVDFVAVALFAAALFALRKWKASPIIVILISGALGLIAYQFI